jgi:thioredoxin 1
MIKIKHFTATWCQPCKALAPVMNDIVSEYPMVGYQQIDIDNDPELAQRYGIKGVPTILFEKNGTVVQQVVGLMPKSHYQKILNNL